MARIQELLSGRDEKLDYYALLSQHPWIVEKEKKCILSPDSDGLLCGLLVTSVLDWRVCGFYDGKVMLVDKKNTSFRLYFPRYRNLQGWFSKYGPSYA